VAQWLGIRWSFASESGGSFRRNQGAEWLGICKSNAYITGFFETGVDSFRFHHPVTGVLEVAFLVSSYPTYPLRFGDATYNLPSFARNVILDVVPLLASKVSAKDPLRAADLIKRLSREDKRFAEWPYAGYLVGWAAGLLEQNERPSQAAKAYRCAFECFEQLIANIQNGKALTRIKEIEVWPWAALWKWKEACLLLSLGDTSRALKCYDIALGIDSTLSLMDCNNVARIDTW